MPEVRVRAARLSAEERSETILVKAIEHFSEQGFHGSTRDLAKKIGITQSLLYKYFPTKKALVDLVYERVYVARWNPEWDRILRDRTVPVEERLKHYYRDYSHAVVQNEWVRILIFAGLHQEGIDERLFVRLHDTVFKTVVAELRYALDLVAPTDKNDAEIELELVWALHASIFYLGMRKWVYRTRLPRQIDALIDALVESFIEGMKLLSTKRKTPGKVKAKSA